MEPSPTAEQVRWFRSAAPYVHGHRGSTLVLMADGDALAHPHRNRMLHDVALLNSLGIRIVLCFGTRPQVTAQLQAEGITCEFHQGLRVTTEAMLPAVKAVAGSLRMEIEGAFSMGMPGSPMQGARTRVCGGNFVTARPAGVRDGVDLGFTGVLRRIDRKAIRQALDEGMIVLLPPVGFSPSGEVFNLSAEDVATFCATQLDADKLVVLTALDGIRNEQGALLREMTPEQAESALGSDTPESMQRPLRAAINACRGGVKRAHLVSFATDGTLLTELFTRDGCGTMITGEDYEELASASVEHVGGILQVIEPLEESGALVRRSRELLESEIDRFTVILRDGSVIGCAALYPFADAAAGELACIAIDPAYRDAGRARKLLARIEAQARAANLETLFVLTTEAQHWFLENGFAATSPDDLPGRRRELYNYQRNSKVFAKRL